MSRPLVKVNLATSLDGFVARLDGSLDWLPQPGDVPEGEDFGFAAFLASVDRLVLGRTTFETVLGFGEWPYGELCTEVLTSRPLAIPERLAGRVSAAGGEPEHLVERWTKEGVRSVYLDGGEAVRRFLAKGLVDELTLTRVPVLLGTGRSLFPEEVASVRWEHLETDVLIGRMVRSRYRKTVPLPL